MTTTVDSYPVYGQATKNLCEAFSVQNPTPHRVSTRFLLESVQFNFNVLESPIPSLQGSLGH